MAQRQLRSDDTSAFPDKFGIGSDGAKTFSVDTNHQPANQGCSGTVGTKAVTLEASTGFANGDLVIIHQSRAGGGVGTAGAWEFNKIASGGGTTSLTMAYDLTNTYGNSGNDQSQMYQMKQYTNVTLNSGKTLNCPDWAGNTGGILGFFATGVVQLDGIISLNALGFDGGAAVSGTNIGFCGEGSGGASVQLVNTNGNGGGGGGYSNNNPWDQGNGGGGGSNVQTNAEDGTATGGGNNSNGGAGPKGLAAGNAGLTVMVFGGGGGAGGVNNTSGGAGGAGAGILVIVARKIQGTGSITLTGATGGGSVPFHAGAGGAGAGGSMLLKGQIIDISSMTVTANGGAHANRNGATTGDEDGGAGGQGRIHIDYASTFSGSTTPTSDTRQDSSLLDVGGAGLFAFM